MDIARKYKKYLKGGKLVAFTVLIWQIRAQVTNIRITTKVSVKRKTC
jgi:hypothetical protein